ncbi:MAG TPA: hypothetical protein ENK66_07375 [Arcobacter sp.]|nr:hypothetical protein [Arcobacter sp.]
MENRSFSKIVKLLLLSSFVFVLTACNDNTSKSALAINRISAYADSKENPEPTIQDYVDANVSGISGEILDELNGEVDALEAKDVDTVEEINTIVKKVLNSKPVAISQDIMVHTFEEPQEVELIAFDDDGDALTYSIDQKPQYGEVTLVDNRVLYTPNTDYLGNDQFSFKVSDGLESSTSAIVSIQVLDAPLAQYGGNKHIIWFNGTMEDHSDNYRLFERLESKEHTVIKGWGLKPFWADYPWYSYKKSYIRGIENDSKIYKNIDKYIEQRLSGKKDYIRNSDSLMIGGFSRGAAFFVPYFLDRLNEFLPGISAKTASGAKKELIIFMMDPVNGSKNEDDYTATSLRALDIYDKTRLVNKLKDAGFSVKLIFFAAGFDYRQTNFVIDKSFYDVKEKFDYVYSAKLGLSHANMSTWYSVQDSVRYEDEVLYSLEYGPYSSGLYGNIENRTSSRDEMKEAFSSANPDLDITRSIFRAYLNERINEPYTCNWNMWTSMPDCNFGYTGSKEPGTLEDVEKIVTDYHNITEKYLGQEAADKNWGVKYSIGDSKFLTLGYSILSNNALYRLKGHSRLGIPKSGTLEGLFSAVLPSGSYKNTCKSCNVFGVELSCECKDRNGNYQYTSIEYQSCSNIINSDGQLTCSD